MFESGEQVLESLKRLRDRSETAILAVERLLEETRSFSQAQSMTQNHQNHVNSVSLADFVETAAYAINGCEPALEAPSQNREPANLTAAQFACQFLDQNKMVSPELSQQTSLNVIGEESSFQVELTSNGAQEITENIEESKSNVELGESNQDPNSPSSKRGRPKNTAVAKRARRSELLSNLNFSDGVITSIQRGATSLSFNKKDWEPDFPSSISLIDILSLLLFSRKGNTPMAIANYSNMFQPCFDVEFILRFATCQFDRLVSRYQCNVTAVKNARLLMLDSIASWGTSDGAEYFDSQVLTANRRPPLLRYYYFARLFTRTNSFTEEGRNKAALQAYMAGISGLCIPSSLNNSNPQSVLDEAVGQLLEKCNSKIYNTAEHLAQDCWVIVAVFGMQFSMQRILNHNWSSCPPYSAGANTSFELAPFYIAARLTQEICQRLETANGILTLV